MNITMLNEVEKRIIQGSFPNIKLSSTPYIEGQKFFETDGYQDGVRELYDNTFPVVGTIKMISYLEDNILSSHKEWTENILHEMINVMINTGLWPDDVVGDAFVDACHLCPSVTKIDRVVSAAIVVIFGRFCNEGIKGKLPEENDFSSQRNLFCALLWLLNIIQESEKNSLCTVDIDKLDFSCNLLDILLEWSQKIVRLLDPSCEAAVRVKDYFDWVRNNQYIVPLSDQEATDIKELFEKRLTISKKIGENNLQLKAIDQSTSRDWELFLQLIFDISNKEESVIQRIIDQHATAAEKLEAIEKYEEIIKAYKAGKVYVNNCQEDTNSIFLSVEKRLEYPPLTKVRGVDGDEFKLDSTLLSIVKRYEDYNYLLIKYHYFRLSSNRAIIANDLIRLALSIISRNLLQDESVTHDHESLFELISSFYEVVSTFFYNNRTLLDDLPYSELQEPSTCASTDTLDTLSYFSFFAENIEKTEKQIEKYTSNLEEMFALEDDIDELSDEELVQYLSGDLACLLKKLFFDESERREERFQQIKAEMKARQIVVSLDIIYLFCDSIRIILQSPNEYGIQEMELQSIKQIYRHLLRIDQEINNTVYSEIPWDKPNLMEMRQERGLDAKSLIEQENHEEDLRNKAFKAAFDGQVRQILGRVVSGSIVDVFNSKKAAQEELSRLPNCGYKKLAIDLFDAVNYEICEKLVERDKYENAGFVDRRKQLLEELGRESLMLPPQTIDSLTTAEFLYYEYVTQDYAKDGFDYSCISSLYYQAFEEAYSALIWREYAQKLNNLKVFGRDFTKVLCNTKRSDDLTLAVQPYFYVKYDNFKLYIDKNKKFSSTCMYGPFAQLMKEVIENRDLTEFRTFFAKKIGFSSSEEMKRDTGLMEKCAEFVTAIENCIDFRNNASHGGRRVGAEQCKEDKKNVISDIESVRADSLGLIQKLLLILNWKKK